MPAKLCRLRGALDSPEGRRRRLYGGGSSNDDRAGVGEETLRTGLRDEDANRVERRLVDRPGPAPGAGDADISRRKGLGRGIVDEGRGVRDGADVLREVLGVGLKL